MQWRSQFAELRKLRQPTPADLETAVWSHYEGELEHDRRERAALPTDALIDAAREKLTADIAAGRVSWSADPIVQLGASAEVMIMRR